MKGVPKDFCDHAPAQLVKLCKAEQLKCKTSSKEAAKQKACWDDKMKELIALSKRGSGSGAKKPVATKKPAGSTDLCSIALNAMRDMMKGVPKNIKEISEARRMALCKSYSAIGNMAAQLAKCTSAELKEGLKNAKLLCAAVATKKPAGSADK